MKSKTLKNNIIIGLWFLHDSRGVFGSMAQLSQVGARRARVNEMRRILFGNSASHGADWAGNAFFGLGQRWSPHLDQLLVMVNPLQHAAKYEHFKKFKQKLK
jgi:hypothetical protein